MWNEPSPKELEKLPELYATEERRTREIDIHLHFFLGANDWYIAEYDRNDRVFYANRSTDYNLRGGMAIKSRRYCIMWA